MRTQQWHADERRFVETALTATHFIQRDALTGETLVSLPLTDGMRQRALALADEIALLLAAPSIKLYMVERFKVPVKLAHFADHIGVYFPVGSETLLPICALAAAYLTLATPGYAFVATDAGWESGYRFDIWITELVAHSPCAAGA